MSNIERTCASFGPKKIDGTSSLRLENNSQDNRKGGLMAKPRDARKDVKKKPIKSIQEKRKAKRAKSMK
jgi:hypothetical protein